mmetsp:Transcript_15441/g.21499  ORF Transcript_15441/g.21499 Transcript_15441/m.21499 type:complete len:83 (+) Transcript_15441:715-963(+)
MVALVSSRMRSSRSWISSATKPGGVATKCCSYWREKAPHIFKTEEFLDGIRVQLKRSSKLWEVYEQSHAHLTSKDTKARNPR